MTHASAVTFLSLVLEDTDFFAFAVLLDFGFDFRTVDIGGARFQRAVCGYEQYFVEDNCVFCCGVEFFDEKGISLFSLILLSACYENCLHFFTSL